MKSFRWFLAIGITFLVVYIVAEYNRPQPTNWNLSYKRTVKIPYGTYLLFERLPDLFGSGIDVSRRSVYETVNSRLKNHAKGESYIFINPAFYTDSTDMAALFRYARAGNQVFIASDVFSGRLRDTLKFAQSQSQTLGSETRAMQIGTDSAKKGRLYRFSKGQMNGCFYNIRNKNLQVLGRNELDSVNFLALPVGKGTIFLHSNPSVFTNVNLMHPSTSGYAAEALAFLPRKGRVIWDDFTLFGAEGLQSPMRFVLTNPDLRWAWYLASGILLLFVLAEVKRRQRAIPVLVPPANRSLEFVNVVGQVYYEEHNNADLAEKMGLYFHEYLRTRFELQLQPDDPKFAELLARKSNMDAALVKNLLAQVNYAQQAPQITDKELIELNTLLENFYKETR